MGFLHLVYDGFGASSGFPLNPSKQPTIYGVDSDGHLRWYQYTGMGEHDPAGSASTWHPHSGNRIGQGWNSFQHLLAIGKGVLAGAEPGGDLRWYKYNGSGETDPTGSPGRWDPNSRNIIGNGWNSFRFLISRPNEGFIHNQPNTGRILGVEHDGTLRFYRYDGRGDHDPSGGTGWSPNSRNPIGKGWSGGFRRLAAIANVILAVEDDGDLRYYRYDGEGEDDPSGASDKWAFNSGNVIGRGWHSFTHLFGGSRGHGGIEIFGVEPNGDLRWYMYNGSGESDSAGASNKWHANSGNVIGRGW